MLPQTHPITVNLQLIVYPCSRTFVLLVWRYWCVAGMPLMCRNRCLGRKPVCRREFNPGLDEMTQCSDQRLILLIRADGNPQFVAEARLIEVAHQNALSFEGQV